MSNNSSLYKRAIAYYENDSLDRAADLFKKLYENEPDYPNAANYYGLTLANLGRFHDALQVWEHVPPSEKNIRLNYNKAVAYRSLKSYQKASLYFKKALKDLKNHDQRTFWAAKAFLIECNAHNKPVDDFEADVLEFSEIVDNNISIASSVVHVEAGKTVDLQFIEREHWLLNTQKEVTFYLFFRLVERLQSENSYLKAYHFALRAGQYYKGPSSKSIVVSDDFFRRYMSLTTALVADLTNEFGDLNLLPKKQSLLALLQEIEDRYKKGTNYSSLQIADIAMTMRALYGDSSETEPIRVGNFKLKYQVDFADDLGLSKIYIDSPPYIAGRDTINLNGEKNFLLIRNIPIEKGFQFDKRSYFTVYAQDLQSLNGIPKQGLPSIVVVSEAIY